MNIIRNKNYFFILIICIVLECKLTENKYNEYQIEFNVFGPIMLSEAIKNIDNLYWNDNNQLITRSEVYIATIKNRSNKDIYIYVDSLGDMISMWSRYYLDLKHPILIGGIMSGNYQTILDTLKPDIQRCYYFTLDSYKFDYVVLFPKIRSTLIDSLNFQNNAAFHLPIIEHPYYIYMVKNRILDKKIDKERFQSLINHSEE